MVTFRLIEDDATEIVYWYFPEGDEDSGHGIIVVDKLNGRYAPVFQEASEGIRRCRSGRFPGGVLIRS